MQQTPGGKSYDAALVLAAALDRMIKDGLNVKETSLGFEFSSKVTSTPWSPGKRLMEYIKNVSREYLSNYKCKYTELKLTSEVG